MATNCAWCATDEFVEFDSERGVAVCSGPGHHDARMWEPAQEKARNAAPTSPFNDGIAAELGLYDDLPRCLRVGEWAEAGVVEHRYGTNHPDKYRWMVDRWGHTAMGPRHYSVTVFLGTILAALAKAGIVRGRWDPATGFFSYNGRIGYWTPEPVPDETTVVTWADLATELGHHPDDWPLLGYRAESS